jgi:hypothetical protein
MNENYQAAVTGIELLAENVAKRIIEDPEAAYAIMQTKAILAVADEQARTTKQLELANLIAYAQLCRGRRRLSLAAEELVDHRMAAVFPEIREELAQDDD